MVQPTEWTSYRGSTEWTNYGGPDEGPVTREIQLAVNYPSALDVHEGTGGPVTRGDEWTSDKWSTQGGQNKKPIEWSSQASGPATVGSDGWPKSTKWTNYGGPDEWTGHTSGPVSGEQPECARRARGDGWTNDRR